jgi:hypothetical protein
MAEECLNCRYWFRWWEEGDETPGSSWCRRYPPVLAENVMEQLVQDHKEDKGRDGDPSITDDYFLAAEETYSWQFPKTLEEAWCGEWRPIEVGGK